MTSFVITARGEIYTDGVLLPDGACRGCLAPAEITGTGEFFIICNPDRDVPEFVEQPVLDMMGTPTGEMEIVTVWKPAPPVYLTLTDTLGPITTIDQNTRYPAEGYFPLLHAPVRVE